MILLYADDPGGCNYLAPLAEALLAEGVLFRFQVASEVAKYAADRRINCLVRIENSRTDDLLANVKLLVVGTSENPDCFAHELVATARISNIPSLGVVDMKINADRRFKGRSIDPLKYIPDWLALSDDSAAAAYRALGFPSNRILVWGHPHYDEVRARRRQFEAQDPVVLRQHAFPTAPPNRPIWLFLAEGIDQLNPSVSFRDSSYTMFGRGDSDFRSVIVLEEIIDAAARLTPQPWIVLRLHPKNHERDFISLAPELGMISQEGDPLPLVWSADLTFGMTTILLIETYLLGRPHLAVLPRSSERAWLYTLEHSLTKAVFSREELVRLLSSNCNCLNEDRDRLSVGAANKFLTFLNSQIYIYE
jgi:hypothetical protein